MKVLLIAYDNDSHISYFPLGLAYVAQALRDDGNYVEIYNQDVYHYPDTHLTECLNKNKFDVVGVGACGGYYQYKKIKRIAQSINNSQNRPMFFMGGHLPSPDPEYFLRTFETDFVVIGEGEETTKELLNYYKRLRGGGKTEEYSKIKGIAYLDDNGNYILNEKRPTIKDIDSISYPAWDLFPIEHYVLNSAPNSLRSDRVMSVLSGRGCPFKCNFCYRMDNGFRPRSSKSIVEEILVLKEKYSINYISFQDELLMSSVDRVNDICNKLLEYSCNVRWSCNGRLNYASKDKNMLNLMKKAGCVFINYGIESMDNEALKNMNKNLNIDMIIKGVENTLEAGISPGLNIIFGNIGETKKSLENDVEFLLKYDDHSQIRTIRPVTPYPGTELYYYAIEKGMIKDIKDFYENKHLNSDLLTCNFTDLSDDEYYKALYEANEKLLKNYIDYQYKSNKKILDDLYINKNINFRGFRKV